MCSFILNIDFGRLGLSSALFTAHCFRVKVLMVVNVVNVSNLFLGNKVLQPSD